MSQGIISHESTDTSGTSPDAVSDEKSTGRDSSSRRWMAVIPARLSASDPEFENGVKKWAMEELQEALEPYSGWVGQIEQGSEITEKNPEGYLHWQIYIEHERQVRFSTLRNRFGQLDLQEARKDRIACVNYVTKEDTRVIGPFWHGEIRLEDFAGKRNDLEELRNLILIQGMSSEEVLYTHPSSWRYARHLEQLEAIHLKRTVGRKFREVTGEYYWGKTGTHKTRGVFELYGYENVYRIVEYGSGAFDSYSGESVLMLDEYRSQFPISRLLALVEGHPLRTGARFVDKWAQWDRVIVVSNDSMNQQYRAADGGTLIKSETRLAMERRFSVVRQYTGVGEYVEEFEGLRL
jgi:hypothetical protein